MNSEKKVQVPSVSQHSSNEMLAAVESVDNSKMDKTLARWIYYENGSTYYCLDCVLKRVEEINANKEFADDVNYEGGDEVGYYEDYADEDYEVQCCKCSRPLFSTGVDC